MGRILWNMDPRVHIQWGSIFDLTPAVGRFYILERQAGNGCGPRFSSVYYRKDAVER